MKNRLPMFYALTVFFWFSQYAYVPFLTPYAESLGANVALIGLVAGSYGLTQMLVRIPLGILSDVVKKRKIFIIMGMAIACISGLGIYVFQTQAAVLIFRGLSGVASATWVIFIVLFSSYYKPDDAVKAVGYLNSANAVGTMTALVFGGICARSFGMESTFLLAALVGIPAVVLGFFVKENKELKKEPIKIMDIKEIARDKNLLLVSTLAIIAQYVSFATTFGFVPIVAKSMGADSVMLGFLGMTAALPNLIVSPLAGTVLVKRFSLKKVIMAGFALSAVSCVTIPFVGSIPGLFVNQLFIGTGLYLSFPLLMGLSIKNIDESKRATAMGFFQALYGLGMFAGPAVAGIIGDMYGLTVAFVVTGLVGFTGVLLAGPAMRGGEA